MYDIEALRGMTPATIRAAFNKSEEICEEHGDMGNTNATGILTKVMHEIGRLNERWASDGLYGLDKIRSVAGENFDFRKDLDEIITFGIREDGVDHNSYVMSRLLQGRSMPAGYVFPKRDYRKILAVRIRTGEDKDLHRIRTDFSLRDITNALHSIDPADLVPGDQFKLIELPNDDRENPEPTEILDRVDKAGLRKLKEEGYKTFRSRTVGIEELEKDGCSGDVACIEIDGFWDPRVPAPKNIADCAVCRVYLCDGLHIVVAWTDRWYQCYDAVKAQIEKAKAALLDSYEDGRKGGRDAG